MAVRAHRRTVGRPLGLCCATKAAGWTPSRRGDPGRSGSHAPSRAPSWDSLLRQRLRWSPLRVAPTLGYPAQDGVSRCAPRSPFPSTGPREESPCLPRRGRLRVAPLCDRHRGSGEGSHPPKRSRRRNVAAPGFGRPNTAFAVRCLNVAAAKSQPLRHHRPRKAPGDRRFSAKRSSG